MTMPVVVNGTGSPLPLAFPAETLVHERGDDRSQRANSGGFRGRRDTEEDAAEDREHDQYRKDQALGQFQLLFDR